MEDRDTARRVDAWLRQVRGKYITAKRRNVIRDVPVEWIHPDTMEAQFAQPAVIEEEVVLVLEIPVRELTTMSETQDWYKQNIGGFSIDQLDKMLRGAASEEMLRDKHPGLQETWEKYQIMLKLCSKESFR